MLTWSRIPIPVKIAVEGGNICGNERHEGIRQLDVWKTYRPSNGVEEPREGVQDIHRGIKPLCPPFVGTLRLIKSPYLGLKHGENGVGRVAGLELVG